MFHQFMTAEPGMPEAPEAAARAVTLAARSWPQFRGPGGNAVALDESIPLSFGPENQVRWKTDLPRGHSSPCIWGDQIFLTGHVGTTLKMICLKRSSGELLWERERVIPKPAAYEHVAGNPANPTPATDGERVVFFFDDYGVIVTDFEGRLRWERRLPSTSNSYSYGASPVLDEGRLYLNQDGGIGSSWLCLDVSDGSEIWKADRPNAIVSFCTPYVFTRGTDHLVLAGGTGQLSAYDARSGRVVWHVTGLPIFVCPSPVAIDDTILFGGWTTAHVAGRSRIESVFDEESGVSEQAMKEPAAVILSWPGPGPRPALSP
jgi:hypothetical protein